MPAWVPHVGQYQRRMPVSLARMYENALDWEHLPWLHSSSFTAIECIESGDWGWRAWATLASAKNSGGPSHRLWGQALAKSLRHQPLQLLSFASSLLMQSIAAKRGGSRVLLELRLDTHKKRWITTTLDGVGKGTQIWTQVLEHGAEDIEVQVDFFVPNIPQAMAAPIGQYYQQLYQRLYDEDQDMMERRQQALALVKQKPDSKEKQLVLGGIESLKKQLPLTVTVGGKEWQVVQHDGGIAVHHRLCPHMLGPLDRGRVTENGAVVCPWHGYEFSLADGSNLSGQRCKLPKPPKVTIDDQQVVLTL